MTNAKEISDKLSNNSYIYCKYYINTYDRTCRRFIWITRRSSGKKKIVEKIIIRLRKLSVLEL